jgi:NAD-dependent SIR2 family protein deacetylase
MLDSVKQSVSKLAQLIRNVAASSVIMVHGAGISVAAGIPDFRTPGTGLYSKVDSLGLPNPEAIFDIAFFRRNPWPFYSISDDLLPGAHRPTSAHFFSKLLEDKNKLLRVYTQNIDGLEALAGVNEEKLVEAHGHSRRAHCSNCHREVDISFVVTSLKKHRPVKCSCGGWIKPDIVFYGEDLPQRFFTLSDEDFPKCKLMVIMGTSLQVQPFSSVVDWVSQDIPRFLLNKEPAGDFAHGNTSPNDCFIKGDCQEIIRAVIDDLKWTDDLLKLEANCDIK